MSNKYVIVTPRFLENSLQVLLDQKRQREYEITIVHTEELEGVEPLHERVRNYLLEIDPGCVLLVGDDDKVPGYRLYTTHDPPKEFVSDVYLAMRDSDVYPRIPVGRLSTNENMRRRDPDGHTRSVPLTEQIESMCRALVAYPHSADSDWQNRVIITGWIPRGPSHPRFSTDAGHDCLRWIAHYADIDMQFENDLRAPDETRNFWGTHDSTQDGLKSAIEKGSLIVRYLGHGVTTGWDNIGERDNNDYVGRTFVRNLNVETKQPLVISTTCHTGDLPSSPSFGETWQTELKSIGFFGADDESLTYFNDRLAPQILREYYVNKRTRVGDILTQAIGFVYENERDGTAHQQKFDETILMYRYLGDPDTQLPKPQGKKIILDDTSNHGPTVAIKGDQLLLGWNPRTPGGGICFKRSNDGRNFTDRSVLDENSDKALALTTFNSKFIVAWRDRITGRVNIMQSSNGDSWDSKVTLDESTESAPALAAYLGKLHLAWRDQNNKLNIMSSSDGISWGNKMTLPETTKSGPALIAGVWLLLAWRGLDNQLNILRSFGREYIFEHKVTLNEWTSRKPFLHVHQGRPHLAWRGGGGLLNVMESRDGGVSWDLKLTLRETSIDSPALVTLGGELLWLWTGTNRGRNLSVMPCKLRI